MLVTASAGSTPPGGARSNRNHCVRGGGRAGEGPSTSSARAGFGRAPQRRHFRRAVQGQTRATPGSLFGGNVGRASFGRGGSRSPRHHRARQSAPSRRRPRPARRFRRRHLVARPPGPPSGVARLDACGGPRSKRSQSAWRSAVTASTNTSGQSAAPGARSHVSPFSCRVRKRRRKRDAAIARALRVAAAVAEARESSMSRRER